MKRFCLSVVIGLASVMAVCQQAGYQGLYTGPVDRSVNAIEGTLGRYLNGDELKSVLTPGEFANWDLKLNAGDVLVADARSDAFDPGLQIVDAQSKVLAENDDRYPGDQRPLLFWRCEKSGTYSLRVRCFRDRSGGQFFLRFKTYPTVDLSSGKAVDADVTGGSPYFVRVSLKKGEMVEETHEFGGTHGYLSSEYNATIAPNGLPELNTLLLRVQPAFYGLMAPVAGDYYIMETPNGGPDTHGKVHIGRREIVAEAPAKTATGFVGSAPTNEAALWELNVKEGDFLTVSTPDLDLNSRLVVADVPDISKFDMASPETNPFYPHPAQDFNPALQMLPKRARDNRVGAFRARRDTKIWIASNGVGPAGKEFKLEVHPAAMAFAEDRSSASKLRIADTDYWAFDAKAGDVMSIEVGAADFRQLLEVRDPDLNSIHRSEASIDQTKEDWRMIAQKPGRYLVAVSCAGNGGAGAYSLSRKVIHARDFSKDQPATGEIGDGETQVWRFTVQDKDPLLMHWKSTNWSYDVSIYDAKGQPEDFQRESIDPQNEYGLVKKPQTYVIVLTGKQKRANYSIGLSDIPGYKAESSIGRG